MYIENCNLRKSIGMNRLLAADDGAGNGGAGNAGDNSNSNNNDLDIEKVKEFIISEAGKTIYEEITNKAFEARKPIWEKEIRENERKKVEDESKLSPLEIELKQLREEKEQLKRKNERNALENDIRTEIKNIGLSENLLPFVLGKDKDSSLLNINKLNDIIEEELTKRNQERLQGIVRNPRIGNAQVNARPQIGYNDGVQGMAKYLQDRAKNKK